MVQTSTTEFTVMQQHMNHQHSLFGGVLLQMIDQTAGICATRHCRKNCVTASMDKVDFIKPAVLGDYVKITASIIFASEKSMEIHAVCEAEKRLTGEKYVICDAYLTFVALDDNGKPTKVPPVVPQTDEEQKAYNQGKERYETRKELRVKNTP